MDYRSQSLANPLLLLSTSYVNYQSPSLGTLNLKAANPTPFKSSFYKTLSSLTPFYLYKVDFQRLNLLLNSIPSPVLYSSLTNQNKVINILR
jgi:hypothetical protein